MEEFPNSDLEDRMTEIAKGLSNLKGPRVESLSIRVLKTIEPGFIDPDCPHPQRVEIIEATYRREGKEEKELIVSKASYDNIASAREARALRVLNQTRARDNVAQIIADFESIDPENNIYREMVTFFAGRKRDIENQRSTLWARLKIYNNRRNLLGEETTEEEARNMAYQDIESCMKALARVHVSALVHTLTNSENGSFCLRDPLDGRLYEIEKRDAKIRREKFASHLTRVYSHIDRGGADRFRGELEGVLQESTGISREGRPLRSIFDQVESDPLVWVMGDRHPGQFVFDNSGNVRLLDFRSTRIDSPVADFSMLECPEYEIDEGERQRLVGAYVAEARAEMRKFKGLRVAQIESLEGTSLLKSYDLKLTPELFRIGSRIVRRVGQVQGAEENLRENLERSREVIRSLKERPDLRDYQDLPRIREFLEKKIYTPYLGNN